MTVTPVTPAKKRLPRPYKPRPLPTMRRFKIAYRFDPVVLERLRSMSAYVGVSQDQMIATLICREYNRMKNRTDYPGIVFPTQADIERNRE